VVGENPSQLRGERRPLETVTWEDCQRFCARLGERFPGLAARLPTEAEWEYACRAGTARSFNDGSRCTKPEGNDLALAKLGWFTENSRGETHPVAELQPNPWGLYDMHGNINEFVQDCWNDSYDGAPTDGSAWEEGNCNRRVLRSGSWHGYPGYLRSAYRCRSGPAFGHRTIGFRLARTPGS
jgi:formylglycine-generating enzyme required for sulfatase activity